MFEFLTNLFKKKSPQPRQATADQVRKYAKTTFVTPARQRGDKRVNFNARQIHQGMGLSSRYPLVCGAIDSHKFEEFARVKLVKRDGVKQGVSAEWTFKLLS
jgi:hypothetical protein